MVVADAKSVSPTELAELIGQFNDVTVRLGSAHESLRMEVARLQDELTAANEQLERSRRLAALGEMAAGIAHEVRNPLGSIRLHARILEQDLTDRPDEQRVTSKILRAVEGLDGVVTDVLTFSSEIRVRTDEVDPSDLFDHAIECCLGGDAEIVRLDQASGRPRRMTCDASLAHRCLVNVIRNAIESMADVPEDHPRRAARLELDVFDGRDRRAGDSRSVVKLRITDTGPGVPDDVLDRVFNPFFTTRATGTGLGLAIVHRIMDAHDGAVRIENLPEGGARVELVFPCQPEPGGIDESPVGIGPR